MPQDETYFTDESVTEFAETSARATVVGLAAVASWVNADAPPERGIGFDEDMERRSHIERDLERTHEKIRYPLGQNWLSDLSGIPAPPLTATQVDIDAFTQQVKNVFGLTDQEVFLGVWRHKQTGETFVAVGEWTIVPGWGSAQPEITRLVAIMA